MVKIINNVKYSTKTATCLATREHGSLYNEAHWYSESLYRKVTGAYFLYGEGGARSPYAETCADGTCSGEDIIPLTEQDAREWAETHIPGEKYIEIFGDVAE